jgi:hypothetical protein
MSPPDAPALRLVIQFIDRGKSPRYRMVAYPAREGLRLQPASVSSRPELLKRLALAIPSFNPTLLAVEDAPPQVIFSGWLAATDEQLIALGVARPA